MCMDYLLDNVIGSFPEVEDLLEEVQPLVRLQGLKGEMRPELTGINWVKK